MLDDDEGMAFEDTALARSLLAVDFGSVAELGCLVETAGDVDLFDEAAGVACLGAAAALTLVGVGLSDDVGVGFSEVETEADGWAVDELTLRGASNCLYAAANAGEGAIAALDAALAVVLCWTTSCLGGGAEGVAVAGAAVRDHPVAVGV